MTHDKGKPHSPVKALTLSEAAQLLKSKADAAVLQAIAAVSDSSKGAMMGKYAKWSEEG